MIDLTTRVSAVLAACLLMTIPLAAQVPAATTGPDMRWTRPGEGAAAKAPPSSSELLAKQPQTPGATGDQLRHYYFADGRTESPYRIYVPKNYDGKTKLPVVLALHGASGNQNYFFRAIYGMPDLMENYGFIFVAPYGYHSYGGYGAGALPKVTVSDIDPSLPPNPATAGRPQWTPEQTQRVNDLSEKDVLNVLAIVEKEYAVDTSRVYLIGHSMGGAGTWYLGQKYADKWAALGVMSGGFGYVGYPLERLKGMPITVFDGEKDTAMHGQQAQAEFARFKAAGLDVTYAEIPDGTHMGEIPSSFPQVIAFLAKHRRSVK
jgi:predicted peptidase